MSQWLALAHLDLPDNYEVLEAFQNIWLLASKCGRQDGVLPLKGHQVDGRVVIGLYNTIGIPEVHATPGLEHLALKHELDPDGMVTRQLERRRCVITEDNLVDVFFASQTSGSM